MFNEQFEISSNKHIYAYFKPIFTKSQLSFFFVFKYITKISKKSLFKEVYINSWPLKTYLLFPEHKLCTVEHNWFGLYKICYSRNQIWNGISITFCLFTVIQAIESRIIAQMIQLQKITNVFSSNLRHFSYFQNALIFLVTLFDILFFKKATVTLPWHETSKSLLEIPG